ncbi:MAG: repeat-containing protein [Nocardia sp.]|uniref:tetratricopeptide repeat protein n=1 Tax=Nocardia sp. TaxID=1821 RepID=UPI0026368C04|nr:tetratricopeptide repeat protein [Nocardia sp.]MCU1645428.1 repeat-containing protein [Nocardia sp.]
MTARSAAPQPEEHAAEVHLQASLVGAGTSVQAGHDASAVFIHGDAVFSTIVVGNNNTVNSAARVFTLAPIGPKPAMPGNTGPAALLDPRYETVPFLPTPDQAVLTEWLTEPSSLSACLVSAPGGYGKTRLAWQICRDAERAGWRTAVARNSSDLPALTPNDSGVTLPPTEQTLVFLDYADRWSRSDLQDLALGLSRLPGKTRLLLTARSEAFWPIASRSLRALGFQLSRIRRSDLSARPEDSRAHYIAALHAYGTALGLGDPDSGVIDVQLPPSVNSALEIHVLALLIRLAQHEPASSIGSAWPELSRELIERELDHWARMAKDPPAPIRTDVATLFRATVFATLTRGLDYVDAQRLLTQLGFDLVDSLITDHAALYPAPDRRIVMWPLLPDRIGEDLLACSLSAAPEDSFLAGWGGPACDNLVRALFALRKQIDIPDHSSIPLVEAHLGPALAVLVDTAARWPHVRDVLREVVQANPQLGILTSGPTMEKIAQYVPLPTLREVATALDDFAVSPVGAVNLTLHNSWVEVLSVISTNEQFDDLPAEEKIQILDSLAQSMMDSGRFDEALTHSSRMMRLVLEHWVATEFGPTELVKPDDVELRPDIDVPPAVHMILRHANRSVSANQPEVGTYWSAVAAHLATSLPPEDAIHVSVTSVYAGALAAAGDLDNAVTLEKALLAALVNRQDQLADESDLRMIAASMQNLGVRLLRKRDYEQAGVFFKEALRIRVHLHEEMPWLFGPEVAESAHNLAITEGNAGNVDGARMLAEQAVAIRRNMVKAVPGSFTRQLLISVKLLVKIHVKQGDTAQALELNDEYLIEWRRAAAQLGSSAIPILLDGLENRLEILHRVGRIDEFPIDVARLLHGTPGRAAFAESSQGLIALSLAGRIFRAHPQVAADLTETYALVLQHISPELIDANTAVYVALGSVTAQAFGATDAALKVLVRSRGSREIDEWVKQLRPQYLEVVPQILHQWEALRTNDDQSRSIVQTAAPLIPVLRAAASISPRIKVSVAEIAHLSAALGIELHEDSGTTELATLAVKCSHELVAEGHRPTDDLLTTLNTLALAYLDLENPGALAASIQAVALAHQRRERHGSAMTDSDFAMCMETHARALAVAGDKDRALEASRVGFTVRLSMVKAGGNQMLPAFLLGCQIAETLLVKIGLRSMIPALWHSAETALEPELWQELQQLREPQS